MAKLKLSGRKLCTTGRKLSVCGCGGGSRCCELGLCKYAAATTKTYKAWHTATITVRAISPSFAFVGMRSFSINTTGTFVSSDNATDNPSLTQPCGINATSSTSKVVGTPCAVPSGYLPSPFQCNDETSLDGGIGRTTTSVVTPAATVIKVTRFRAREIGSGNDVDFVASWTYGFSGNTPTVSLPQTQFFQPWVGSATVTPIYAGGCCVGLQCVYDIQEPPEFSSNPNRISGTSTFVVCDKLTGCGGETIDCSSSSPPALASPLDLLDEALFS